MDIIKDLAVVLGLCFLIFLIPYLLVMGKKGILFASKSFFLWIAAYLGFAIVGAAILLLIVILFGKL